MKGTCLWRRDGYIPMTKVNWDIRENNIPHSCGIIGVASTGELHGCEHMNTHHRMKGTLLGIKVIIK